MDVRSDTVDDFNIAKCIKHDEYSLDALEQSLKSIEVDYLSMLRYYANDSNVYELVFDQNMVSSGPV